jgi:hypothetical protein
MLNKSTEHIAFLDLAKSGKSQIWRVTIDVVRESKNKSKGPHPLLPPGAINKSWNFNCFRVAAQMLHFSGLISHVFASE